LEQVHSVRPSPSVCSASIVSMPSALSRAIFATWSERLLWTSMAWSLARASEPLEEAEDRPAIPMSTAWQRNQSPVIRRPRDLDRNLRCELSGSPARVSCRTRSRSRVAGREVILRRTRCGSVHLLLGTNLAHLI
jgi:hypothetical protein